MACMQVLLHLRGSVKNQTDSGESKDSFGEVLLDEGISEEVLLEWCKDPAVKLPDGTTGSLFDALEDTDVGDCLQKIVAIHKSQ